MIILQENMIKESEIFDKENCFLARVEKVEDTIGKVSYFLFKTEIYIEKDVEGCEPIRNYFGNLLEMQKANNIAKLKKGKFENSYILEAIMRFYRRRKGAKKHGKKH